MSDVKKGDIVRVNGVATKVERVFKYKETVRLSVTHMRKKLTFVRHDRHDGTHYWRYTGESYSHGYQLETEQQFLIRSAFTHVEKELQKVHGISGRAYENKELGVLRVLLMDLKAITSAYFVQKEKK